MRSHLWIAATDTGNRLLTTTALALAMATLFIDVGSVLAIAVLVVASVVWFLDRRPVRKNCKMMIDKGVQGPVTYRNMRYQPLAEQAWGAW